MWFVVGYIFKKCDSFLATFCTADYYCHIIKLVTTKRENPNLVEIRQEYRPLDKKT
jgi:hypothetical protein